jgi:endogenous inhibitor of DNA gyrase (YacG/DUF329 family)
MPSPTVVNCPICGKAVAWTIENFYRPFCSERCKQIDLGAWAKEEYRVPASAPEGADGSDALSADEPRLG